MKARFRELLDRDMAAIEIYNNPDFLYREEAFAVLAVNGWELLLKAKCLPMLTGSSPSESSPCGRRCRVR